MEKKRNPPIHERNNVIPFPREKVIADRVVTVDYHEVDILLCSLCGSGSFFLLNDDIGKIGCSQCGYLIGTHYKPNEER